MGCLFFTNLKSLHSPQVASPPQLLQGPAQWWFGDTGRIGIEITKLPGTADQLDHELLCRR